MTKSIFYFVILFIPFSLYAQSVDDQIEAIFSSLNKGLNIENKVIELRNNSFPNEQSVLTAELKISLDKIAILLMSVDGINLNIQGHTNTQNNDNLALSSKQSSAVYTYLIEKGIPTNRLKNQDLGKVNSKANSSIGQNSFDENRIELRLEKNSSFVQISNIIVLNNGNRIGAKTILLTDADSMITYQKYGEENNFRIHKELVDSIYFTNGKVIKVHFESIGEVKKVPIIAKIEQSVKVNKSILDKGKLNTLYTNLIYGLGVGIPYGSNIKQMNADLKDLKAISINTDSAVTGSNIPRIGVAAGLNLGYRINAKWGAQVGLLYTQYGFRNASKIEYHHPTIQIDWTEQKMYRVHTDYINLLLGGTYQISNRFYADASLMFGKVLVRSYKERYQYETFCNHERDETMNTNDIDKGTYYAKKSPLGISLGLTYLNKKGMGYRFGVSESGSLGYFKNHYFSFTIYQPLFKSN